MYYFSQQKNFFLTKKKCIVLLVICFFVIICRSEFVLSTVRVTMPSQSFTVPYNKTLAGGGLAFAYVIQCGTISQDKVKLIHVENQTSVFNDRFEIKFTIDGLITMVVDNFLQVKVLVSSYQQKIFTLKMVSTLSSQSVSISLPCPYDPTSVIKSLQPKVFPLVLPMTQTLTLNQTHLTILPTLSPTGITSITFSIMIVTREYESFNIGLIIDNLQLGNLGWIILFNNDSFFDPNEGNMLVGMTGYKINSVPVIDMQDEVDYEFSFPLYPDQRSVFIFYDLDLTTPTIFTTAIFIFSQTFPGCPNGGFLTYTDLYYDSPLSCQACHQTCLTCTSTNYSLSLTDDTCCLSCSPYKYFEQVDTSLNTGKCTCYPGLEVNSTTQECIPCSQQCLGFTVNFMRSSTQSLFLLSFSSLTTQSIPMQQNLRIYVNNNFTQNLTYKLSQMKRNFYSIIVDSVGLQPCETKCELNFTFTKPWLVLKQNRYESLTQNTQSLFIENYYNVGDKIPDEINQAFAISSMLVAATAGGGLSSALKMLFQLQQMIEFHKYLNMQLPLIFKQFIQSLSIFKFLDVTTLLPFDIDEVLQSLSTDQFDTKGPIKSVYYENGANFYKNIIPVLLSFGIVIVVNFTLFFIIRLIPFKICWRLSQKLKVRAIITFSDMLQTLILPTVVFAHFQLFLTHYRLDIIWIYGLTMFLVFSILFLPFMIITYVFINRHRQSTKQVYQDLMQDCDLSRNGTYLFYFLAFYRKVLFGMALFDMIPGRIQGYAVLGINVSYLMMIVYIVMKKIFHSKLKMLTKTLNALCVIGIQAIMIYYNTKNHSIQVMLDLGATCVYLAIIATVTGVVQAFIKIFEVIFQNVKKTNQQTKVSDNKAIQTTNNNKLSKQKSQQKQFTTPMYCGLNDKSIQKMTPLNSKDSLQTIDVQLKDQKDKRSLWNRPKKKLNFLSNLMSKKSISSNNNNNSNNSTNTNSLKYGSNKYNNEQSFSKMNQNSIDFLTMDSNDQLGYNNKNNDSKITKRSRRRYQGNKMEQSDLSSSQKLGSIVKRFNSVRDPSIIENNKNNKSQDMDGDYNEVPVQKRTQRRVKTNNIQKPNQLKISSNIKPSDDM